MATPSNLDKTVADIREATALTQSLWLYTNLDCNLRCSYCVTASSPDAPRRPLGISNVRQLVDEAAVLGIAHILFSGGEPFLLEDLQEMLAYSSARIRTTVLTNATLLRGERLEKLAAVTNDNLKVQVSLDAARPEHNDAYRGRGTWVRTVEGIRLLQERGIRLSISTTVTPVNGPHLEELRLFLRSLGIQDEDHVVRPLVRGGFSHDGQQLGREALVPEPTVTADGVYWHPLLLPEQSNMLVCERILPLAAALERMRQELERGCSGQGPAREKVT